MRNRLAILGVVICVLLGVLAGVLIRRTRLGPGQVQIISASSLWPPRAPSDLTGLEVTSATDRTPLGNHVDNEESQHDASQPELAAVTQSTIHVTYGPLRTPAGGCKVSVVIPTAKDAEKRSVSTTTDAEGKALVAIPPEARGITVQVQSSTTHAVLATWSGPAEPLIEIDLPDLKLLHMHIVFASESDRPPANSFTVSLGASWSSALARSFVGLYPLAADYTLEAPAFVDSETPIITVQLSCEGQIVSSGAYSVSELEQPPGPKIAIDTHVLQVSVVGPENDPVKGATIRGTASTTLGTLPTMSAATAPDGSARLWCPRGGVYVCIGAEGFRAFTAHTFIPGPGLVARLSILDPTDCISVKVLNDAGMPIDNALVSISPDAGPPDQAIASIIQARTNERGIATCVRNVEGPATVVAYHPDYGSTPRAPFNSRAGSQVVIYLEAICQLNITLWDGSRELTARRGPSLWCVMDRARARLWSGHFSGDYTTIDDIPVGEHILGIYLPDQGLLGFANVDCLLPGALHLDVLLTPAFYAEGRVTMSGGGELHTPEITAHCESLPSPIADIWCKGSIRRDGRFRVLCGGCKTARFVVTDQGVERLKSASMDTLGQISIEVRE
jgi:hypothetical protein